jgi:uncharacterized protein with ATP-grasp and redox domains
MIRQTLDAVRLITDDESIHEQVLREVLRVTSTADLQQTPPAMGQKIHRLIRQLTEIDDPYRQMKKKFNIFVLALYPKLERIIAESKEPLETAVRLAVAGNIIDLGVKSSLKTNEVYKTIDWALTTELDMTTFEDFKNEAATAKSILYLGDNAGEIVFDRILIDQLGPDKITFVVKGRPVINDATIEDAQEIGLTDLVRVIDNGDDAPGTILKSCSEEFRHCFKEADLIIAKGQGNYETLSDLDKNIFFLLKAKCPVIADHLGCKVGAAVLHRQNKIYSEEVKA